MAKQLIINADDYGRTEGVSRGIRFAHLHGVVTSTTCMMNLPGIEKDLELALSECPALGLGVHLNITAGSPLSSSGTAHLLCSSDGLFNKPEIIQHNLPSIDLDAVTLEWEAQITKFTRITGKKPGHLDSHHHVSYFSTGLFRCMLLLAQKYHAYIRLPVSNKSKMLFNILPFEPDSLFAQTISELLLASGIHTPDRFYECFYGQVATPATLISIIKGLSEGTHEIMCHPGFNDSLLASVSTYSGEREKELGILTDTFLRDEITNQGIKLVNFHDIA